MSNLKPENRDHSRYEQEQFQPAIGENSCMFEPIMNNSVRKKLHDIFNFNEKVVREKVSVYEI